jgi:hypothetical protein
MADTETVLEPLEASPMELDTRGAIEKLSLKLDALLEKLSKTEYMEARTRYSPRSGTFVQPKVPSISVLVARSQEKFKK